MNRAEYTESSVTNPISDSDKTGPPNPQRAVQFKPGCSSVFIIIIILVALGGYSGWSTYSYWSLNREVIQLRDDIRIQRGLNEDAMDRIEDMADQCRGIIDYERTKPRLGDNDDLTVDELLDRMRVKPRYKIKSHESSHDSGPPGSE